MNSKSERNKKNVELGCVNWLCRAAAAAAAAAAC
jgi:hypothetical protein